MASSNVGIDLNEVKSFFVSHMVISPSFPELLGHETIERETAYDWHDGAIKYAESELKSRIER
jgi:hypothetical protein